jgi:methionyl-tRNA formyltransferase
MSKVSIVCSDPAHPVNAWLERWVASHPKDQITIHRDPAELAGGDFLFLVSCHQILDVSVRDKYRHTLVLHASDLPRGRGWSPHVWQVLEGADRLVVSLLKAEDAVDAGDIWAQETVALAGTELHDEIHARLFDAEIRLMDWALQNCDRATPRKQAGTPSHYRKRTPADSAIDPQRPLAESFDLLRVVDPQRYPAHFELRGQKYTIRIEKMKDRP